MNKLGKSGAILIIVGSAFMLILSIVSILTGSWLAQVLAWGIEDSHSIVAIDIQSIVTTIMLVLAVIASAFSIVNIVLASLVLSGRKNLVITTGVLGIVSLLFGVGSYIIPGILLLIGSILLFCSNSSKNITHETVVEIKTVQPEIRA